MFTSLKHHIYAFIRKPILFAYRRIGGRFLLWQYMVYGDESRLHIAPTAKVQNAVFNTVSGHIIIEDYAFLGHNVSIITGTHDYKKTGLSRQQSIPPHGRDVIIKRGAWIASNATIIGPCIIGENAVVGACCLITENVSDNTICTQEIPIKYKKIEQS